ncbi:MAG: hypothetical protein ACK54C_03185 [Betaproteobacteria bacterium]
MRIAIVCSKIVNERQRHGSRRILGAAVHLVAQDRFSANAGCRQAPGMLSARFMDSTQNSLQPPRRRGRWPAWIASAAAAAVAAKFGWDFGVQLSGVLLGVITAANFAVMSALLVDTAAEKLWGLLRGR